MKFIPWKKLPLTDRLLVMARLRVEKLQEAIKQELSKILLQDIKDPRIKFVTVTGVELTDDISLAKVYVSLYERKKDQEEAWQGLNKAVGLYAYGNCQKIRAGVLHRH